MSHPRISFQKQPTRRDLGRMAIGAALGAKLLSSPRSAYAKVRPQPPGIKIGSVAPANPTDDDLLFFRQLGVDCVFCAVTPDLNSVDGLLHIRKRYADAGLTVHNIRNLAVTNNQVEIVLNRPGRDKKIEDYKRWLRTLGGAGFHFTLSNFNLAQIVTSSFIETRGSRTRDFDLNSPTMGIPAGVPGGLAVMGSAKSLYFGREYSAEEIWANYTYFVRQVVPVAEEAGIVIAFHPDDPPVPSLFGVPRIMANFNDCRKALKIANSPNVGICLCCGTWAEGGTAMGIDPAGAIRWFGARKQIYEVHFRNVSSPLPHFQETHVDNGYYDMFQAMKAMVDVKYDGIVHLDHAVPMVGGDRTYQAFAVGYMRALRQRAQAESAGRT
ncbi:MAG TPA: mannonate dehydratase [Bryobacteraceae bacterium]|nr:mannonate dehydratase [Bryobacteraceae bacterium]